jgi:hypothetical protein
MAEQVAHNRLVARSNRAGSILDTCASVEKVSADASVSLMEQKLRQQPEIGFDPRTLVCFK